MFVFVYDFLEKCQKLIFINMIGNNADGLKYFIFFGTFCQKNDIYQLGQILFSVVVVIYAVHFNKKNSKLKY